MSRLHQYPQVWWIKSIFQGKCISRKLLQFRAAAAQHVAVPRHCCCSESRICQWSTSLPYQWVSALGAASRQPLQNKRCGEWGTWRFFSPKCYHLAICYVLPTPLFLRLAEQKLPLIKIQNYKACLAERKQYLSHIWFWESYNSHKSWAKLSSITLINCAQKNKIEANTFQSMLTLKVCCSPTAFSFNYKKKSGFLLNTILKKNKKVVSLDCEFSKRIWFSHTIFSQP